MESIFLNLKSFLLVITASLLLGQAAVVAGSTQNESVPLPTTPVGKVATTMLQILNSGDEQKMLAFIRSSYAEQSLKETLAVDLLVFFRRVYQQSVGINVMQGVNC